MKKFSISIFSAFLFLLISFTSSSQTTLVAGDIAFTGYNASGPTAAVDDEFSFVLLKNVLNGTKIRFTDIGWTSGAFQVVPNGTGENVVEWTSTALNAGTEITIKNLSVSAGHGTVANANLPNSGIPTQGLSLATSGDQVLAYQINGGTTTFISAIHMNVFIAGVSPAPATTTTNADWDGTYFSLSGSGLPPGLVTGQTAVWIWIDPFNIDSEQDNARFNGCGLDLSTAANVRAAVNNRANWLSSDSPAAVYSPLASGCTFLPNVAPSFATNPSAATLCASLSVSFNATTTGGGNTFKWQEATNSGFTTGLIDITTNSGVFTLVSTGGNSSTLTISDNTTKNGKYYRCVATNNVGPTNSTGALLTVTSNTMPTGAFGAEPNAGTGNASFIFRSPCQIIAKVVPTAPLPVTGTMAVDYWNETTALTDAGSQPYVRRHYQISPSNVTAGTVTLYFTQADFDNFNSFTSTTTDNLPTSSGDALGKANLRIAKYPGISGDGSGLPATYTGSATIIDPVDANIVLNTNVTPNRWEVTFNVTSFSGFLVQSAVQAPLPVKLASFTAKINPENQTQLNWKVVEQVNIQEYNIEKSTDAVTFNSIGKVLANNKSKTEYEFKDSDLAVGKNYYRLKMVEQDGSSNWSKIVPVDFKPEISITLYPNPTTDLLSIDQIGDYKNQKADLFNEKGVLVKTFSLKKDNSISIKDIPSGIYILKLADGKSFKVLKNN